MKAVVIATTAGRSMWLADCLASLDGYTRYPIVVVNQYDFELGKIKWVYDHTDIDEFLFLQDSVVVKEYAWIDEVFDYEGSVSLCRQPFFMYLGKYTRSGLSSVSLPLIHTKRDAIMHENSWTQEYVQKAGNVAYLWPLQDGSVFTERHGRRNMVLENEHLIKYKGTWDLSNVD